MSLPPLAEMPPATIRLSISPEEWEACLDSWLALSNLYLRLTPKEFEKSSAAESPLVRFTQSFYLEKAIKEAPDSTLSSSIARKLERTCFLLVHRMLLAPKPPRSLLEFAFLASFCRVHTRSLTATTLLENVLKRTDQTLQANMEMKKSSMTELLELPPTTASNDALRHLADVMRVSPDIATLFMTGSDFLDGLISYHQRCKSLEERKAVVAVAFLGLLSLTQINPPNVSLLSDHLYTVKAPADTNSTKMTLGAEIVTNTPLVTKLRRSVTGSGAQRLSKLLDTLETYRTPSIAWPKKQVRRRPSKGKGRVFDDYGEMHMHRMSLVTQVQDIFPDLGSGFVLKLLDEYGEDVEQVTRHLLDDSLPTHLRDLDRTEVDVVSRNHVDKDIGHLAPGSTPPPMDSYIPERKNVFDDDELDRLEVDASRLHIGKRKEVATDGHGNKAAILSALAAFDSDDDERDDTYDIDDVGGTVDTAHPDGEPPVDRGTTNDNDLALFAVYTSSPDIFARTPDARKKKGRHTLKSETGMTDEAIEGWAIMLQRDPRRMRRLEAQFSSFDGRQANLARTSYREGLEGTETEDSDGPSGSGGFRGRGRGGRGRERGRGNATGTSSDPSTAHSQRRKEANKGSRANHNRRDQRARKMARGGFAG